MSGYAEFKSSPKTVTTSDQIGPGQIKLFHLSEELFSEIRKISLHSHTGSGSRKVNLRDLEGAFGKDGFILYSNDGSKRYRIQINNSGTLTATELT